VWRPLWFLEVKQTRKAENLHIDYLQHPVSSAGIETFLWGWCAAHRATKDKQSSMLSKAMKKLVSIQYEKSTESVWNVWGFLLVRRSWRREFGGWSWCVRKWSTGWRRGWVKSLSDSVTVVSFFQFFLCWLLEGQFDINYILRQHSCTPWYMYVCT